MSAPFRSSAERSRKYRERYARSLPRHLEKQIIVSYNDGCSLESIAMNTGLNRSIVSFKLRQLEQQGLIVRIRRTTLQRQATKYKEAVQQLSASGKSPEEICAELACPIDIVRLVLSGNIRKRRQKEPVYLPLLRECAVKGFTPVQAAESLNRLGIKITAGSVRVAARKFGVH